MNKEEPKAESKLKNFTTRELANEIATRCECMAVIADKEIVLKKCDFYKLAGFLSKAQMEVIMLQKQLETQEKQGGIIVPSGNVPGNFNKH